MDRDRPPENKRTGVSRDTRFEYFVLEALEVPPGTPAPPRPDRPPYRKEEFEKPAEDA